jgi:hypothetical protein
VSKTHYSLNSPACSCVSITLLPHRKRESRHPCESLEKLSLAKTFAQSESRIIHFPAAARAIRGNRANDLTQIIAVSKLVALLDAAIRAQVGARSILRLSVLVAIVRHQAIEKSFRLEVVLRQFERLALILLV